MTTRTQLQKDADAVDLDIFNAADKICAFVDRYKASLRSQQIHTMHALANHMHAERHLFRSLMHPEQRTHTQGWNDDRQRSE